MLWLYELVKVLTSIPIAFILYRQHYQASVVASHPGLANPEISKIIGEQWRDQPLATKNEWKRLAEEEKQRHQRQYPDYRYQPRRAGKAAPKTGGIADGDSGRCAKCNGRFISTPATPSTPFTSSYSHTSSSSRGLNSYDSPGPNSEHFVMSTPRNMPPHSTTIRHQYSPYRGQSSAPMPLSNVRYHHHEDDMEMASPEYKRRRFNDGGESYSAHRYAPQSPYQSSHGLHIPQQSNHGGGPPMNGTWYEERRQMPLPSPTQLISPYQHPQSGAMEPPPRPSPVMAYPSSAPPQNHSPPQAKQRHDGVFDESLRLPPLQTSLPPPNTARPELAPPSIRSAQANSVEAMVMTIPFMNKIKVLSKISPALAVPGAGSPVHEVRGAVIAVEGPDSAAVAEVGRYIEAYLSKDDEIFLKSWEEEPKKEDGTVMTNGGAGSSETFDRYLNVVREWHRKGKEMESFVTTPPPPPVSEHSASNFSDTPISPTNTTSSSSTFTLGNPSSLSRTRTPVALLPRGFSLSTSDRFASRIPINDAYAPVDHWQWAATLFRGIIGPDLTIYVTGGKDEDRHVAAGVDIRNDCAAMVVSGSEEKNLRRLGFEVLEFVRGFGANSAIGHVSGSDSR